MSIAKFPYQLIRLKERIPAQGFIAAEKPGMGIPFYD